MNAEVGDWIVVEPVRVGGARRIGRVMAVEHADGSPPYLVKWTDNDRETLFFPGPEAHVETTETVVHGTGR